MLIILHDLLPKRNDRVFYPTIKWWNENSKVGMGKYEGYWSGEASTN